MLTINGRDVLVTSIEAVETKVDTVESVSQIRSIAAGDKTIDAAATKYLEIDSGTNGAEILSIAIKGVVSADWTLKVYVPVADAVAAPAAEDKRMEIEYDAVDLEGGLLNGFAISYNCFLQFTNDGVASNDIDDVVIMYRSAAALTTTWEV